MGCKFGLSVVLLSGGIQNFQSHIRTQHFFENPQGWKHSQSCPWTCGKCFIMVVKTWHRVLRCNHDALGFEYHKNRHHILYILLLTKTFLEQRTGEVGKRKSDNGGHDRRATFLAIRLYHVIYTVLRTGSGWRGSSTCITLTSIMVSGV